MTPKDDNIWVFGAWFGYRYADNSKYLFEWVNNNKPDVKAVWITKSKDVLGLIDESNTAYYYLSLRGLYYILRAKVFLYTGSVNDILMEAATRKSIKLNLWHGTPFKKIMHDDIIFDQKNVVKSFLRKVLRWSSIKDDYVIAPSEEVQNILASAFALSEKNVWLTGYPRNDILIQNKDQATRKASKVILYAPTHRQAGQGEMCESLFNKDQLEILNEHLTCNDAYFKVRMHHCHWGSLNGLLDSYSRIGLDTAADIEISLLDADFLITDYSSCMFDYLLLDRPIIYFPYDLEQYNKVDRDFYYSFEDIVAGDVYYTWETLLENFISCVTDYRDCHSAVRRKIRNKFYALDDDSSRRVYSAVNKYLNC